jgi:mRNA interferase MazF
MEQNRHIRTVIVAPLTTAGKDYPTRINCRIHEKEGQIVLDQIRTIDKTGLIKYLGAIDSEAQVRVISVLQRLFAF